MAKDPFTLNDLVGKTVVIGLNYARTADGSLLDKHQLHGRIMAADSEGVAVVDPDGREIFLPPAAHAFVQARPGNYRLRATGEVVEFPDLEATWQSGTLERRRSTGKLCPAGMSRFLRPNPRLQRTPSAPLSRKPLGAPDREAKRNE